MKEIFVFTASNSEAKKHLNDTIKNPVKENKLLKHLDQGQLRQLEDPENPSHYYCWGATPGPRNIKNWQQMKIGDYVLIYYQKAIHFYSTVLEKLHDPELAEELWGTDNNKETWEYIYFLTKPIEVYPPIITKNVAEYLHTQFQGFTRLSDERRESIYNNFGNLENFINHRNRPQRVNEDTSPVFLKAPMRQTDFNLNLFLSIKTKPFIILAGLSGTGKSRLVRTIAFKTCPDKDNLQTDSNKPGNFELIKVRPNWHDSTEVVGYESRISGTDRYIVTDFIRFIVKAWKHPNTPFFLCLDEMNLAPVEQYFAEYLSVFETRNNINGNEIKTDYVLPGQIFWKYKNDAQFLKEMKLQDSEELQSKFISEGLTLPKNLIVMGTVNMDETTHSFSKKVLDRAMTIEMNDFDLTSGLEKDNDDWTYPDPNELISPTHVIGDKTSGSAVYRAFAESGSVIEFLQHINEQLSGTPFSATYRVRDEFLIYCYHSSQLDNKPDDWLDKALDNLTHMKILPKIEGEADQTKSALDGLKLILNEVQYPKSHGKLEYMADKLERFHYTDYWL